MRHSLKILINEGKRPVGDAGVGWMVYVQMDQFVAQEVMASLVKELMKR